MDIVTYKFAARLATKQWISFLSFAGPLLSTRPKQQKLFLFHCILSGYSIIPPSSFIPHLSTLRHSHHLPLYRPVTSSTAYSASFFPSVIPSWNNLLLNTVLATSHSAFKSSKIKLNSNLILQSDCTSLYLYIAFVVRVCFLCFVCKVLSQLGFPLSCFK